MQDTITVQQLAVGSTLYEYIRRRGIRRNHWDNNVVERLLVTEDDLDLIFDFCRSYGYWCMFGGKSDDGLYTNVYDKHARGYVPPYTREEGERCRNLRTGRRSASAASPTG